MSNEYFDRVESQLAQLTREGAHLGRPSTSTRLRDPAGLGSAVAVALSLGVVAVVVWVAFGTHRQPVAPSMRGTATDGAAPALLANFRLLRRPAQPGDSSAVGLRLGVCTRRRATARSPDSNPLAPHSAEHVVACGAGPTTLQRRYGLKNPASLPMRHVTVPTTRIQTWLIAGSRGACWNAVGPQPGHVIGQRCFSSSDLGRRILVGTLPPPRASGFEIGLVTDTARAVELRKRDGATTVLPLADGYFYAMYQSGDEILADTASGIRPIQTFGTRSP